METIEILTSNREETFDAGKRMAAALRAGDVLALSGDLGSGKTVFTKGVCRGLDVTDGVTSPTFTLVQEYNTGRLPVYHFDFYRLDRLQDIEMLDLDYYFGTDGISVIEWAEKGERLLPLSRIQIALNYTNDDPADFNTRRLIITGPSDRCLERILA